MKLIPFLVLFLSIFRAEAFAFELSQSVYKNSDLPFTKHEGTGAFDSYLTMEIKYGPVKELFKQVAHAELKPLRNRGEAHITVITPVEYFEVLKEKVSIKEINEIAVHNNIQKSVFEVVCLGKGSFKKDETFYLVLKSADLIKIRNEIQKLFISRGGKAEAFKASHFFPHITLGFTTRDLHEADGVIKDEKSCFANIEIVKK